MKLAAGHEEFEFQGDVTATGTIGVNGTVIRVAGLTEQHQVLWWEISNLGGDSLDLRKGGGFAEADTERSIAKNYETLQPGATRTDDFLVTSGRNQHLYVRPAGGGTATVSGRLMATRATR